jgi:predicted Zn-dependent peptidase
MNRRIASFAVALALGCAARQTPAPPSPPPAAAVQQQAVAPAPQGPDRSRPPEPGPVPELRLPEQKHFTLGNGLAVRLVEYHRLPIVAMNLVVDAGGARDPAARPGLASFTASMVTEGTKTRSATRISDETGFLGASLHASAGHDSASLGGATLSKHLGKFLELFSDVAMNPSFPRRDFERVQDERIVTLVQQRDQPHAVASKAFAPVFWGAHPYGHYVLGTEESIGGMRPRDLAAFHAAHWRPGGAELVVVGDVAEAELRPLLERTLGAWKRSKHVSPLPPELPAAPKRVVLLEKTGAPQVYLLLGMPGLRRASDDFVPATVAFQVLGGGMSSRLFRNLREDKGYTYGVYARSDSRKLAGVSFVAGSVKADVAGPAVSELLSEFRRLRDEPVTEAELADAKNALVLSLPADFATAGAIAGRLADLAVHGLPDDYWNRYADLVRKVTVDDVRRVAQNYLDPAKLTIVMVGSPDAVSQFRDLPLGPIEVRPAPPPAGERRTKAAAR